MPAMNALTVLLYLFGHAGSIRRVASSPMAVPVGILLVFSAAVARNYDQVWFGESAWWLFGPLLFSFFSGAWLLLWVCRAWAPKPFAARDAEGAWPDGFGGIAISFFGLFWMTAPIAWLYAIPVERWYEPVEAARWNVRLLLIVALWRVLLMTRVVSVIGEVHFLRALPRVLVPAAIATFAVGFFAGLGKRMMAGMAGLRNSPAEDVLLEALSIVMGVAFWIVVIGSLFEVFLRHWKMRAVPWRPEVNLRRWQGPWVSLVLLAALCWWMSIRPQKEQRLTHQAKELLRQENWAGFVTFLSQRRQEEFAPSIPLPPTAWEFWHVRHLPCVIEQLRPDTSAWVRELYAGYLDTVLEQWVTLSYDSDIRGNWIERVLEAAKTIPEIRRVVKHHSGTLERGADFMDRQQWSSAELRQKLTDVMLIPN
jgi:hypothetical protein